MGVEEVLQELAEESREKERQKTEAALAAGFSCLEEYEQKRAEEWQQMIDEFEDFAKEQCLITGQSMEQFMAERFQAPPDPQKNSFLPILEPCDCQEHINPLFCPQSLVEYKSQDLPGMMAYLDSEHHLKPEDLKIDDGNESKRLEKKSLERAWDRIPVEAPMKIPFWANADSVLQQIIHQDACHKQSITPNEPPVRTPSLLSDTTMGVSPSPDGPKTASMDIHMELEPSEERLRSPYTYETPLSEPPSQLLSKLSSGVCPSDPLSSWETSRTPSGLSGKLKRRPKATAQAQRWRINKSSRGAKRSWKPAMGLRSRNIQIFYELGCNSKMINNRH